MKPSSNAVICFVRAHLRRRLFVWFAFTIFLTGLVAVAAMEAGGGGPGSWKREVERTRNFVSSGFEHVWDTPSERETLARTIQRDFEVTVTVLDTEGNLLSTFGPSCSGHRFEAPVVRNGRALGMVTLCTDRYRTRPWKVLAMLAVACSCLWAGAGAIARRLARPLGELARVAGDIGRGNLKSRVKLGHHHHGEVAVVGCAINEMAERIEAHVAEQRQLLASVSHELRTPLARIRLLTELGREKGHDTKTFDELDREVMEIDALVGDLLASSRIDFKVLNEDPIDAVEAAHRALERAGEGATKLVVEATGARVRGDATLLARALANLIDNANKHGGGLEALRISRENGHLRVTAEDHGEGFPAGEEAKIFEPFFRKSENGTLGLGLALVKRIAEAHHGRAYAENRPQGGALVGIELPSA